jgi:hypothetical protein
MPEEPSPYDEIRKRVEKRFKRRTSFITDAGMMLLTGTVLSFLWLNTDPTARVSPVIMLILVGGLTLAFFDKLVNYVMGELQDRAIQREIEREREYQLGVSEKAKRDDARALRLSDDGELIEFEESSSGNGKRRSQ